MTEAVDAPEVTARRVAGLALPALGALAAEPLYLLIDTALVGHLGATPLGGLALGATVLAALLTLATFLEYGPTGAIARALGAGRKEEALDIAVQGTLLAVAVGVAITLVAEVGAEPFISLLGGNNPAIHEQAVAWLRIAALGAPFVCVALAGQAWLRGYQDTVTPFVVVLAGNTISAGLSAALIYGAGLGIRGSAIANALAQSGSAAVFALLLRRRGARFRIQPAVLRSQLETARDLSARTLAFLVSWSVATGVAAHMGATVVAAHQVCIQLWEFLALTLDALAIAAQALVGEQIGGGHLGAARALSWRLVRWSTWFGTALAVVLLAGLPIIPRLFVSDPAVLDQIHRAWPLLALMQPAAGAVFAFDGILIGAGDTAFLARITTFAGFAVYIPLVLLAGALGWGIVGIWVGLTAFVLVRLLTCVLRMRGERWWRAGRRGLDTGSAALPAR